MSGSCGSRARTTRWPTATCWSSGSTSEIEVASTRRARRRGLLGRDACPDGILLTPARAVHTFGMRFDLDVAYLDAQRRVVAVTRMRRNRLGRPRWRARSVLEAEAGAFERWGLGVGDVVEVP